MVTDMTNQRTQFVILKGDKPVEASEILAALDRYVDVYGIAAFERRFPDIRAHGIRTFEEAVVVAEFGGWTVQRSVESVESLCSQRGFQVFARFDGTWSVTVENSNGRALASHAGKDFGEVLNHTVQFADRQLRRQKERSPF